MIRAVLASAAVVLIAAGHARAQQPREQRKPAPVQATAGTSTSAPSGSQLAAPTAEMWLYQQELLRREDPRTAVREKAEFRAAQRQRRIAARKWFGLSNARPVASPTPGYGDPWSPSWASNTWSPYRWSGYGHTTTILTVRRGVSGDIYGLW